MQQQPDQWFVRCIRRGLAALIALRLAGHPPADTIDATAQVWVAALWPIGWRPDDSARISEAFRQLALLAERWPVPAEFLRCLPPRPEPVFQPLPPPALTEEELAEHRAYLHEALKKLGMI